MKYILIGIFGFNKSLVMGICFICITTPVFYRGMIFFCILFWFKIEFFVCIKFINGEKLWVLVKNLIIEFLKI